MKRKSLQYALMMRLSLVLMALMVILVVGFAWHLTESHHSHVHNVRQFILDLLLHLGWTLPLAAALTVLSAVLIIRSSMAPLLDLASRVQEVQPGSPLARCTDSTLPAELIPLVTSFDKAAARLNCALKAQTRFTANAAHELRTPLTVLTTHLEHLAESGVSAEAIRKLQSACARMARVVGQLTALARVEGSTDVPEACTALSPLLRDVVSGLAPLAVSRDVKIGMDLESESLTARGSPETIEPILRNVIENAVLHAPAGTEVVVKLGTNIAVVVEDAGPGIPASLRDQVFERFWRGSWSRHDGSGLGLAIVREAAARIGAKVALEDASTGGARVTMHFQAG